MLKEWIKKLLKFLTSSDRSKYTVNDGELTSVEPGIVDAVIPRGVKYIRMRAFQSCTETLESVVFSDTVAKTTGAFDGCKKLARVDFGNNIEKISDFDGCLFSEITIPEGVTLLDGFRKCAALKSVTVPGSVKNLDGFSGCESLEQVVLSEGVKHIGRWAFSDCKKLTSVTIPASVSSIGAGAFDGVKTFHFRGTKEQWDAIHRLSWRSDWEEEEKLKWAYRSSCRISINHYLFVEERADGLSNPIVLFNGTKEQWEAFGDEKKSVISDIISREEGPRNRDYKGGRVYTYVIRAFSLPEGATIDFEYKGE